MERKKKVSIIELNGKRYDAHTGRVLEVGAEKQPRHSHRLMDIARPAKKPAQAATTSSHVHQSSQRSHALMRHIVKKPTNAASKSAVAMEVVTPAVPLIAEEEDRLKRATKVKQSSLISRFGDIVAHPDYKEPKLTAHIPVSPLAVSIPQLKVPEQIMPAYAPKSKKASMIEKGLRAANSHARPAKIKKTRLHHRVGHKLGLGKKAASIATASLAFLVLGGFIAYQNIPNIAVRYASVKAGVDATLPGYQPAGFAVSKEIEYKPGEVALEFKANADERSYKITQKTSGWNSEVLKQHIAEKGDLPQTYPENGRTIYLYGESNATWVDRGVLYDISGNSSLSTDQLIKIVSSM